MAWLGGAILRQLQARGETNIVTRSHAELDLTDQAAVRAFMQVERPDVVILAAANVVGFIKPEFAVARKRIEKTA